MFNKCHLVKTTGFIWFMLVCFFLTHAVYADAMATVSKGEIFLARSDEKPKKKKRKKSSAKARVSDKSPLPSVEELIDSKLSALLKKQTEQEQHLADLEVQIDREEQIQEKIFDSTAYVTFKMINNASPKDYLLEKTEIFLDSGATPIAYGRKMYGGLPGLNPIYFGPISNGCHTLKVTATYVRLKNDLISRFLGVKRVEQIVKEQTFIAKDGYHVEIVIEGFEQKNSLLSFFRGPTLRLNNSVTPSFIKSAPIVSLDSVLVQGRAQVYFTNEDAQRYKLIRKSLSLDGLPILENAQHNEEKENNLVFDAPLREGKHSLWVELLFTEKKAVLGGALYNFKLDFNRDFYVLSGQTTMLDLTTMAKNGLARKVEDNTYAKATSKVFSTPDPEFFPDSTCLELSKEVHQPHVEEIEETKPLENEPQIKPENNSELPPIIENNEPIKEEPATDLPSEGKQGE